MKNSMSNLIISITSSLAQTETMRHVNRPTSTPTALSGNQCTCIRSRWKAIIKVAASDNRPASTPYDSDSSSTDSAWAGRCMACLVFTGCDAETKIACSPELRSLGDALSQLTTTTPTHTSTTSTNTQLAIIAFAWHNSTRITHQRTTHSRRTLRPSRSEPQPAARLSSSLGGRARLLEKQPPALTYRAPPVLSSSSSSLGPPSGLCPPRHLPHHCQTVVSSF